MTIAAPKPVLFDPGPAARPTITSVHVRRLHGRFTYDIPLAARTAAPGTTPEEASGLLAASSDRVTLLYGSNGTGKTSILRLIFHALSAANNRRHRSTLFKTSFESFVVFLTNGMLVGYLRSEEDISGPFTAVIQKVAEPEDQVVWRYTGQAPTLEPRQTALFNPDEPLLTVGAGTTLVNPTYGYPIPYETDEDRFLRALDELAVKPVLLGDSRAIVADALSDDDVRRAARSDLLRRRIPDMDEALQVTRDLDVSQALGLVRGYLSQLALAGTQAGSQRVDTVYLNVASTIVHHAATVGRPRKSTLPALRARVVDLADRAARFHQYGLLPEFPSDGLLGALESAALKNGPLLERVLHPYLDGLEERMEALEPGLLAVSSFVDALNSFLEGKHVEFTLRPGLSIVDDETGETLDASALSSGEKQIVLLFSDIVALQHETSVFLIDEPELSLNPRWQRQLMPALLGVTATSGMQLIAATHSIEILAKYRRRLHKLDG